MSLFPVGHIDNTGSEVQHGMYNSVPNYPMVHEDRMYNRMIRLTVLYSKLRSVLLKYDQKYCFTLAPFLSLMFMSAPFSTRHSTVYSRPLLAARCRGVC